MWLGCACVAPPSEEPTTQGRPKAPTTNSGDPASEPQTPTKERIPFKLLQANVGNVSPDCAGYKFKLCSVRVEVRIRAAIRAYRPDIVALQELVPPERCAGAIENNADRVCHPAHLHEEPLQARRLVGPDYTIACDARQHFDCIAVRADFASIQGCTLGAVCMGTAGSTAEPGNGCDVGFSVATFRIYPKGAGPFEFVNAHPPSGPAAATCRKDQLEKVFAGAAPMAGRQRGMISGDFNLDPFYGDDASEAYFRQFVGPARRMRFHSGTAEHDPPHKTAFTQLGSHVWDHVASDFAEGSCTTLGEALGTERLDGGAGSDHRALLCDLSIKP
jgi:endonuclease/exonuclease/phosphatase family metal-dependent hydrolase